ncbi:unnamed protein product [Adineta steineri]|uniref:Uncharacterized protein n=1 Tax=Adineta steineri TaxID=433720 RepID=A0A818W794_9BILA|nr:unnamed protein product [Adineta steineri]CAF3721337.1 unnamed protein product [Adineta steineri]
MDIESEIDIDYEHIQLEEYIDPISNVLNPETTSVVGRHTSTNDVESVILNTSNNKSVSPIKFCLIFTTFTCISMAIGIIIVCFTYYKPTTICQRTFKRTAESATGHNSRPYSIALADFNNDNKLDGVVANSGEDNIGILLQIANVSAINQVTYSTGTNSRPHSVIVNNFNQDNFLDIIVANFGTNNIGIFLGEQNGTFANITTFSTGNSRPYYINAGDFNNDNKMDIVVVNYGTDSISIYFNNGDGMFLNQTTYFMGYDSIPYSVAIADLNHDKILDLAVVNYGTNNIAVLFGDASGIFSLPIIYTTNYGSQPSSIIIADINNDHELDLIVSNYGTHSIGIFYGFSNGTFDKQNLFILDVLSHPQFVTTGDVNKDNQTDIIILDSSLGYIQVLPGFGNGSFSNLTIYMTEEGTQPYAAAIGDIDNDNKSDIAVANYGANNVLLLFGYFRTYSVTQTQILLGHESNPPSVATGDFNSDHYLDIVVVKTGTDSFGILLGYGNGSLAPEISYSVSSGSSPYCVCVGDFNNDTRPDIALANYGTHNVGVFLNQGNGSFTNMFAYPTGDQAFPISVVVGDFNYDSILDIAAADFGNDDVAILLGYGNGSFSDAVTYSTGYDSDPSAIVVDDFNHDNILDLAVANSETSNVGILFGNRDGSFQVVIVYSTGFESHPDSIITGNINHDQWLDIIIADSTSDNIAILFGYENGTFGTAISYTDITFSNPSGLALGDVNYDNNLDIIITNFGTDNVGILAGDDNGSFTLARSYPLLAGAGPKGVLIANFDNDITWEIVIAEAGIGSVNLLDTYTGADFLNEIMFSTGTGTHPDSVTIGDVNNDNILDVISANSANDNIGVFLGYGNGTFASWNTFYVGLDSHPQDVVLGDFNHDNQIDIATANGYNDSISVLLGFGNGSFSEAIVYPVRADSKPYSIVIADLNNDQKWDFVVAEYGRDNVGVMLGCNCAAFKDQQMYSNKFSLRPTSLTTGDFNNDGYLDIAGAFAANDSVGILFGYGNGAFQELIMYSAGYNSYPSEIISVDINHDNILDIIVANSGSSTLGILLNYGDGTFAPVMLFSTGNNSEPYGAATGDFNNDTHIDVVVANYRSNSIGIFVGYGNGSYGDVIIYSTTDDSRPQSVAVGDFNQDNQLDIVVANYRKDNMGIFIANGNATFQNQIVYSTGYLSMPTFIIVDDFNSDNISDVAVSNKNSDNIGILYGYGNGTFASTALYPTGDGTSPQAIRSGDFNNDAAIDIAVVSPGNNYVLVLYGLGDGRFLLGPSYSTGTKSGPISLAVGDFDGNGRLDISTANYLMDNIGVHISYGNEIFGSESTFSTGTDSSPISVAVSDFNNDGQTDVVVANYGTNNIGILMGFGNGSLAKIVTYSTGDGSGPVAVAVGDLNQDNKSDIIVANSQSDNIYLFFGLGNGTFSPITIYSTGLGSGPYAITVADLDNDQIFDIIVIAAKINSVLVLQGYGNGTFGNQTSYVMGYNYDPYAVAIGDFNGDHWLDIAVANYGGDDIEILLKTC